MPTQAAGRLMDKQRDGAGGSEKRDKAQGGQGLQERRRNAERVWADAVGLERSELAASTSPRRSLGKPRPPKPDPQMPNRFWDACNGLGDLESNRPQRMQERRHRRPDLHGRILRRPHAPSRVALRRLRPLNAVPEPDIRPLPLRSADATGSVAVEVRRPRARIDPTMLSDRLRVIVASAVYRGCGPPCRLGRHARQQAGQADRPGGRDANRLSGRHSPRYEAYRGRFGCMGARASRPQRRACARRHPHPSLLP